MDILTRAQSRAITAIATEQLGFFQDNELWGPAFLEIFMEDADNYGPIQSAPEKPTRYFSYGDKIQHANLTLVRLDDSSPVIKARFFAQEGCTLSEAQIARANAALEAVLEPKTAQY